MSKIITDKTNIVAIADAVRSKTGSTEELSLGEIINEIGGISGGKNTVSITIKTNSSAPVDYLAGDGTRKTTIQSSVTDDVLYGVVLVDASSYGAITATGEYYSFNFATYKYLYYFLSDGGSIQINIGAGGSD